MNGLDILAEAVKQAIRQREERLKVVMLEAAGDFEVENYKNENMIYETGYVLEKIRDNIFFILKKTGTTEFTKWNH